MVQQESAASTASRARSRSILRADHDLRLARHRTQTAGMKKPASPDR